MDITGNTMNVIKIIMDLKKTFLKTGKTPDMKQHSERSEQEQCSVNQGLVTSIPSEGTTLGVWRKSRKSMGL